jgi:hypothetical protein
MYAYPSKELRESQADFFIKIQLSYGRYVVINNDTNNNNRIFIIKHNKHVNIC